MRLMSTFNRLAVRASLAAAALLTAAPAFAAAGDPTLSVVAPADRLTLGGVLLDAKPLVKLVFAGLVIAILYAAFVYIRCLTARRDAPASGATFLSALAAGGPLIGFFGAAYGLADMCIGIANVRPAPSMTVLAPGFAEAGFCATLGLLAGAIAVIGSRHLTGRNQAAGAAASLPAANAPPSHLARTAG